MVEDNWVKIGINSCAVEFDASSIPGECLKKTYRTITIAEDSKAEPFAAIAISRSTLTIETSAIKKHFRKELREYQHLGTNFVVNPSDPSEEQIGENRWWVINGGEGSAVGATLWLHRMSDQCLLQAIVVFEDLAKRKLIEDLLKSAKKANAGSSI